MARKRRALPLLEDIEVVDVAAEGKAIAKVDGLTLFVPFAAPGDRVDIQLTRKRKHFAEGRVIRFRSYSDRRVEPPCTHFGVCGGCKWQHLPYEDQLKFKQKQVKDNLERIGKVELPELMPILGAPSPFFYRNKLEFTFSNKRWLTDQEVESGKSFNNWNSLGFHVPGRFDKVLDIRKCWLQDNRSNQVRNAIREFCFKHGYTFFDLREQSGLMRTLIIRNSSLGEWMVIVVFYEDDAEKREKLMNFIAGEFPWITSLLYVVNQKANDTIFDQEVVTWAGREFITEEMEGLRFKVGPKSFFQTNSEQAHRLYDVVRRFARLTGEERVYDLYTGTGTIALFIARNAREVIGIEQVEEAIADARENARLNEIENARFFVGDMKELLTEDFIREQGRPDVIITDPPRVGMHGDVIKAILSTQPVRIVYVSCNPATQARDLALLDSQYKVEGVQPVDMFPHTHHVENVVLLVRRCHDF